MIKVEATEEAAPEVKAEDELGLLEEDTPDEDERDELYEEKVGRLVLARAGGAEAVRGGGGEPRLWTLSGRMTRRLVLSVNACGASIAPDVRLY